jgi:hypothetical protein
MSSYSPCFGLPLSLIETVMGLLEHLLTHLRLGFFANPFAFLVEITPTVARPFLFLRIPNSRSYTCKYRGLSSSTTSNKAYPVVHLEKL